jgi:hypothetical protein
MSNQTKLRTTQDDNSMKPGIKGVKYSRVYQDATSIYLPLENIAYSHDVEISLTLNNPQTITIPCQSYKFIKAILVKVILGAPYNPGASVAVPATFKYNTGQYPDIRNPADFWLHRMLRQFQYTLPNSEEITIDHWGSLDYILQGIKNPTKYEAYRQMNGAAFTQYNAGDELMMLLPLPWCSLHTDIADRSFPFPLHLMGDQLQMRLTWDNSISTAISPWTSISAHFIYGDLADSMEYKNTIYRYLFHAPYTGSALSAPPSTVINNAQGQMGLQYAYYAPQFNTNDTRVVTLNGFKPGDCPQIDIKYVPSILPLSNVTVGAASYPIQLFTRMAAFVTDPNQYFFYGSRLKNIEFSYSGQIISKNKGTTMKLYDILNSWRPSAYRTGSRGTDQSFINLGNASAAGVVNSAFSTQGTTTVGSTSMFNPYDPSYLQTSGVNQSDVNGSYTGCSTWSRNMYSPKGKEFLIGEYISSTANNASPVVYTVNSTSMAPILPIPTLGTGTYSQPSALGGDLITSAVPSFSVANFANIDLRLSGRVITATSGRYDFKNHRKLDYTYRLDFGELLLELTNNGYTLGVDFQFAQCQLSFIVDSDDSDVMCAMAENATGGTVYYTQYLTAEYQLQGTGALLIR